MASTFEIAFPSRHIVSRKEYFRVMRKAYHGIEAVEAQREADFARNRLRETVATEGVAGVAATGRSIAEVAFQLKRVADQRVAGTAETFGSNAGGKKGKQGPPSKKGKGGASQKVDPTLAAAAAASTSIIDRIFDVFKDYSGETVGHIDIRPLLCTMQIVREHDTARHRLKAWWRIYTRSQRKMDFSRKVGEGNVDTLTLSGELTAAELWDMVSVVSTTDITVEAGLAADFKECFGFFPPSPHPIPRPNADGVVHVYADDSVERAASSWGSGAAALAQAQAYFAAEAEDAQARIPAGYFRRCLTRATAVALLDTVDKLCWVELPAEDRLTLLHVFFPLNLTENGRRSTENEVISPLYCVILFSGAARRSAARTSAASSS